MTVNKAKPSPCILMILCTKTHSATLKRHENKKTRLLEQPLHLKIRKQPSRRAQKKEAKQKASGRMQTVRRSKRLWFEQHRWSMISGGHLLVGGRDAKGNDSIVKKHLSGGDMYLHADIHGAQVVVFEHLKDLLLSKNRMDNCPLVSHRTNSSTNLVMSASRMRN